MSWNFNFNAADQLSILVGFFVLAGGGWFYMDGVYTKLDAVLAAQQEFSTSELVRDSGDDANHVKIEGLILGVRTEHSAVTTELSRQTTLLEQLVKDGDVRFKQREDRFEELETEHKNQKDQTHASIERLFQTVTDLAYRIGLDRGHHDNEVHER